MKNWEQANGDVVMVAVITNGSPEVVEAVIVPQVPEDPGVL